MKLHDEIMNIPCEPIEGTESEVLAFQLGHKQARHAAAELAARLSEWQNEAAAALAHFVSLSSRPDDRRIDCRSVPASTEEEMSGGAFNYACRRVEDFAEELRAKIANNGKENDYGEKCEFSAETITRLQSIVEDAERTANLMKAAEWLYSGDTGEDDLAASVLGVCPKEHDAGRSAVQTIQLQDRVHTASGYTVLEAMENAEIFKVTPLHDGMFLVDVLCDYYFRAYLTKAQILALAEELRAMACGHDGAEAR